MATVYLMYEMEKRELESRIYMTKQLLDANFDVVIFQHTALSMIASFMAPGYICLKSTSYQFDSAIRLLALRGFKIIAWQEEGLHHFQGQEQSPVFSKNSAYLIDKYFAWHPADSALAIRSGVDSKRVEIVGNVRFELLSNNYIQREEAITSKLRVLVLTNFDKSALIYNFTKDPNLDQAGREFAEMFWLSEKNSGERNVSLYRNFFLGMQDFSEVEIRVRPYFYEQNKIHEEFGIPTDSFHSIADSLKNCDILVHYGSTGGVEAATLGIPNLILARDSEGIDKRILECGKFFDSEKAILLEIKKIVESDNRGILLAKKQYHKLIANYGFDLRKSLHTTNLIKYCQIAALEFPRGRGHYARRIALLIAWSWTHLKYILRMKLSKNKAIKARSLNKISTLEKIWVPLRQLDVKFEYDFRGRLVRCVKVRS